MSSEPLAKRRIVVAVTGGIAAYKAADLVSRLRKAGAAVRVAMTRSATRFVAPLTFETIAGHAVYADVFDGSAWEMEHIGWARWAEALVVAPATANTIAKFAHGLADDPVSTLALAYTGPVWIAPAMNTAMWAHPATQANLALLRQRGVRVIDPASGALACGETGAGRLLEPEEIVRIVSAELATIPSTPVPGDAASASGSMPALRLHPDQSLHGRTVLVTAGPTHEKIDPVRFMTNRSSGKMGCALAEEARARGARVLLVHGPMEATPPPGVELYPIETARQLLSQVQALWEQVDVAIFAAAVANFELEAPAEHKIKATASLTLNLSRTPDIAAWCGEHRRPGQVLIGFAAETQDLLDAAARKIRQKRLDLICANDVSRPGLGFGAEDNQVTLLDPDGKRVESPHLSKPELAAWIWDRLIEQFAQSPAA